jgi:transcriptional regulator with XRE-family HTH domain
VSVAKAIFDAKGFYDALSATVAARGITWKQVGQDTGVSQTTLSRMRAERIPDAASMAALANWAGLNASDFVAARRGNIESLAMVSKLLRNDPHLDETGAQALDAIVRAAYDQFRSRPKTQTRKR